MKLLVNREAFVDALELCKAVVPSKTPKAVLTAVRIATKDKALVLSATDMELALRYTLTQADITAQGEVLLPAERLLAIAKSISDDTLSIGAVGEGESWAGMIKHSCGHVKLFGYKPDDHPPFETYSPEDTDLQVDGPTLSRMLAQTDFAVAREPSRYAINGILFKLHKNKMTLAATDGHRLAYVCSDTKTEGDAAGYVIPRKTLPLLRQLLEEPDSKCRIRLGGVSGGQSFVTFAVYYSDQAHPTVTLRTVLMEGTFPPYEDTIPRDTTRKAKIHREGFIKALSQASLLTNEESKGVRLSFTEKTLQISSRTPDRGEAVVDLNVEFEGEPIEIGFNHKYLLDQLATVNADHVTVEMNSPNKPMLVKGDMGAGYVVMPVNLS
jgi:DNA polymerase-3 subunit beta